MKPATILLCLMFVTACQADETVRGYGGADKTWMLSELDGRPFPAKATLIFPEAGRIAGEAPCNAYSAEMSVPYPWFEAGPIMTTRRACPDLAAETRFLEALAAMTLSEVLENTLVLSTPDGREMVFTASP